MWAMLQLALSSGVSALLWTVLGATAGLLIGGMAFFLARWLLRGARRRRPATMFFAMLFGLLVAVPLAGLAGAFFGAARALTAVVTDERLVEQAARLGFDAAEVALREARGRLGPEPAAGEQSAGTPPAEAAAVVAEGDASLEAGDPADSEGWLDRGQATLTDQLDLGLRLVEGEERFPIDSVDDILAGFSEAALRRALAAYEGGRERVVPLENGGAPRWIASVMGARLLEWLIELPERQGTRWTEAVAADLRSRPQHADGLATGRELGTAIARVHVVRPAAKWTYWSIAINGWVCAGSAAAVLVFTPLLFLLVARLFSPLKSELTDEAAP